jgi:hypothetical protein
MVRNIPRIAPAGVPQRLNTPVVCLDLPIVHHDRSGERVQDSGHAVKSFVGRHLPFILRDVIELSSADAYTLISSPE